MQLNRQNTSIFFKLLIQIQIITQAKLELMDRKNLTLSMFCKTSISIA